MSACVSDAGYEPPDPAWPLSWQQIDKDKVDLKALRSNDTAQKEQRLRVINQCALDEGLYDAQDAAWMATIRDMFREDPESVVALKESGVLSALEESGPAPFLTIRQLMR